MPDRSRGRATRHRRRPASPAATRDRRRLEALRLQSDPPSSDRLFLATLRLRIPSAIWTGPFSEAHPEVRLEALNRTEVAPDVSVSDYWIGGGTPGMWGREIERYDDVLKVESLAQVGNGSLYRITYQNPPVVSLYQRMRLPLQFPVRIQAGRITWEVVARYSEFEEIMRHMRSVDPQVSVVSLRRQPLRSHLPLLTEAQQELLAQAMAAGYFAVPRGITLTELARKLERNKSAISESIALIEQKLLETALRPGPGLLR